MVDPKPLRGMAGGAGGGGVGGAAGGGGQGGAGWYGDAIAQLVAALLNGDQAGVQQAVQVLNEEHAAGRAPVDGHAIRERIETQTPLLNYPAFAGHGLAVVAVHGQGGDVQVPVGQHEHHIKIKAQLYSSRVASLSHVAWVRGATDALRFLRAFWPDFADMLSPQVQAALNVDNAAEHFQGWSFAKLWVADVAGLTSKDARQHRHVDDWGALKEYCKRQHLLHMCEEKDTLIPIASIPVINAALERPWRVGFRVRAEEHAGATYEARVFVGGAPFWVPSFTYRLHPQVHPPGMMGEHKLHGSVLRV